MSKVASVRAVERGQQVLAGQPAGRPGVDEPGQGLDQHRTTEIGQIIGELVELTGIRHRALLDWRFSLPTVCRRPGSVAREGGP